MKNKNTKPICTNGNCTHNFNYGKCNINKVKSKTIHKCGSFKEMGRYGVYFGKHGEGSSGFEP